MSNEELTLKVGELEERIKFLYNALDNQLKINQKLIDRIGELQDLVFRCSSACENNSRSLLLLTSILKNEP